MACWKDRSKYGATPGRGRDRLDQAGPSLGRLQVGHPDPLDAVDRGQLGQQRLEQPQVAEVLAVGRGVLADQEQLARRPASASQRGLGEHVGGPPGDERAAEGRDRAERAAPVAAGGQLQRRHRAAVEPAAHARGPVAGAAAAAGRRGVPGATPPAAARSTGVIGSSVRRSCGVCGRVRLAGQDVVEPGGDVGVVVEAEHGVGLGQRLGELLAVPLGQAADRDDRLRRRS